MGARTNLALVRGAQVMAVALLVVVAYTSTLEFLKQKKIDLYDLEQKQKVRPKPKDNVDSKLKSKPQSKEQTTKPKEIDSNEVEPEQQQGGQGCSTPPGGGPPVNADFRPC
tara:strand:- start:87 stop:419 length:333 start_codon:yes stop_codon:yes gene_type:complete